MYDRNIAKHYHLVYENWHQAADQQAEILRNLLPPPSPNIRILDTACGIGTQAIGLARLGYTVDGSDLSEDMVDRARHEAAALGLSIKLLVSDMRDLSCFPNGDYEVVINMVNSVPHLDDDAEILSALESMKRKLTVNGMLVLSLRDYERDLEKKTTITAPQIFSDVDGRRLVFQVWDWEDDRRYNVHLYVTHGSSQNGFDTFHFCDRYRAVTLREMEVLLNSAGFRDIKILSTDQTGFYQPIITARV